MHHHSRPSPVTASPASSPRTNPTRTNNQREEVPSPYSRRGYDLATYHDFDDANGDSAVSTPNGPSKDAAKKMEQIIQYFHTKAAIIVLQARVPLPVIINKDGTKKVNKWFQIETDDTFSYRHELSAWKSCDGYSNRPPPLIVETFINISELTSSESLVLIDDKGRRWDVLEALNNAGGSYDAGNRHRRRNSEVILERWRFELKDPSGVDGVYDFGSMLPAVYRKCIVFFRSLFATTKLLPAWRIFRTVGKSGTANYVPKVNCRILTGDQPRSRFDALTHPLYDTENVPATTEYSLGATETPVGQLSAIVSYRNECNFRVDDAESLLSSRFMGADELYFQPSLGVHGIHGRRTSKAAEVGSLPAHKRFTEDNEPIQAYGSLSTFHGDVAPRASSPISALRAAKTTRSDTESQPVELWPRLRPLQTSRASIRSNEGITMTRRPSVSFQPFKAGSLSSSPGPSTPVQQHGEMAPPQSPQSLPRASGVSAIAQARNRSTLTAGMPATLRGGPIVSENGVASSASSSPKPAPISRYSSSFTHRRGRSSFGASSRVLVDDDQGSSGKGSLSSSAHRGSGTLAEAGPGASSESFQTDDDNISEFLKVLDSQKRLQSFEPSGELAKRTSAQLSRYQLMRESHNALTESMSSSTLLHRSSISSSRQLSSVPQMVAATSMSTSSSPGKPVSPHTPYTPYTPHTPAIPSRLSANSIAEYAEPRRPGHHNRTASETPIENTADIAVPNELGTSAIDIPTSPRPYYPHARRSSSVAQDRSLAVEEDLGDMPFGIHRSMSLGADHDGDPPDLSAFLRLGQAAGTIASPDGSRLLQPAAHISESSDRVSRQHSSSLEANDLEAPRLPRNQSAMSLRRPYLGRFGGRGVTPTQTGLNSSLIERGSGSGSGTSERGSGRRYSFTRTAGTYDPDEEPLLFQMSEIGRENFRRSIDETRSGGSDTGQGELGDGLEHRDGEPCSGSQRGSQRGSRRGW